MGARQESAGGFSRLLKLCDAFPKQREEAAEFFHRTTSGGVITLVSACVMALLFLSELSERDPGAWPGPPASYTAPRLNRVLV